MELFQEKQFCCAICGQRDDCKCAKYPGVTVATLALINTLLDGDWGPEHHDRIAAAEHRLAQAYAEAVQP